MKTNVSRYPAGALNLRVFECPHWRAMCLPLPLVKKHGSKSFDLCGGKLIYKTLQSTDDGGWYWIFLVDIADTHVGKSVEMPDGWDYRNLLRGEPA